jgi:hypothetical protein
MPPRPPNNQQLTCSGVKEKAIAAMKTNGFGSDIRAPAAMIFMIQSLRASPVPNGQMTVAACSLTAACRHF